MKKRRLLLVILILTLLFVVFNSEVRNYLKELTLFCWTFIKKPMAVGAIIPSSPYLAKTIINKIRYSNGPIRILEVGAGTGVITEKIIEQLQDGDILDVVELQDDFCYLLKDKFKLHKNVIVNCLSILDWNPGNKYDFLISGIPFNSCSVDFLEKVFDKYQQLVKKGGIISYFEYIALAKIKLFFLGGHDKEEYSKVLSTVAHFRSRFAIEKEIVFLNLPPANIYHLRVD